MIWGKLIPYPLLSSFLSPECYFQVNPKFPLGGEHPWSEAEVCLLQSSPNISPLISQADQSYRPLKSTPPAEEWVRTAICPSCPAVAQSGKGSALPGTELSIMPCLLACHICPLTGLFLSQLRRTPPE